MLSIFTLSVLGAFGVSNALTDVGGKGASDDDHDDGLRDDDLAEGLGGNEDLIERLDMYAALGMSPPDAQPTSEAFLPAEDYETDNVFDFVDDAVVADLTNEELDMLSDNVLAAQAGDLSDDEPTEVIAVSVGLPGAHTPDAAESGFRTALGADDEITLNIADDLPGQILAVHMVFDTNSDDDQSVGLRYALGFYMLPEGQVLPEGTVTGSETDFIEAHGLQKLGEVDMGRFEAHVDPKTGDTIVTNDSRQAEPPHVLSNRPVTEVGALFS